MSPLEWFKLAVDAIGSIAFLVSAYAFVSGRLSGWFARIVAIEVSRANRTQLEIFNGRYLVPVTQLRDKFEERQAYFDKRFMDLDKKLDGIADRAAINAADAARAIMSHSPTSPSSPSH